MLVQTWEFLIWEPVSGRMTYWKAFQLRILFQAAIVLALLMDKEKQGGWVLFKRRMCFLKECFSKNWKIVLSSLWNARWNIYKRNTLQKVLFGKYARTTSAGNQQRMSCHNILYVRIIRPIMEESSRDQPWYSISYWSWLREKRWSALCCLNRKSASPRISASTYHKHVP